MKFCDLSGKTILVTGASSGIGKQSAILLSRLGATLYISGRDQEKLQETYDSLEGSGHGMKAADLAVEAAMDGLVSDLPALNGIVHSAGIIGPTPAKFIRQENIDRLFRINFEVPVLLTGKILMKKILEKNSSIVFFSSVATRSPYFGGALYGSAKAALESYSRSLALEMAGKGVRSNIIIPGLVRTPLMTDPAREGNPEIVEDSLNRYLKKYPMGVGEPGDVANTVAFLLADESRWISGSEIMMGGVVQ